MKKVLLIAAVLVASVSFSKAQGQGGGGGGRQQGTAEERAQRTVDGQQLASLNLTADQKAKLLPLLVKTNKSTDSLNATVTIAADADQAARQAAMAPLAPKRAAITDGAEKTFVSWLTPDQKKAYDALLATAKERNPNATGILSRGGFGGRGQGGGQGGGGNRPAGGGAAPATN